MTTLQITEQYKQLLDLVAGVEAFKDSYNSIWPSSVEPTLTSKTILEVYQFQSWMLTRPGDAGISSAVGRYQFISSTLKDEVKKTSLDPRTTVFAPRIQDYLIFRRIDGFRQGSQWLSGSLSDKQFMINLSKEFAGVPVPEAMQGANRFVQKGESYYAGDRVNKSNVDPDNFLRKIKSIRTGVPVDQIAIEFDSNDFKSSNPQGTTLEDQYAGVAAGGGNYYSTGSPNRKFNDIAPTNVYDYDIIDPFDDRYDFRTGRKVRDLLVNGTDSLRNNSINKPSPFDNEPGTRPQPGSKEAESDGELEPVYSDPRPNETQEQYRDRLREETDDPYLRLSPEIIEKYFSESIKAEEPKPITGSKAKSRSQELGLGAINEKDLPDTPSIPSDAIQSIKRSF